MGAYENNLRHMAEPSMSRDDANSGTIEDHEALWLAEHLRSYAHYRGDDTQSGIAVGYASYIDHKVRKQGNSYVTLYAHTEVAAETLIAALFHASEEVADDRYPAVLHCNLTDEFQPMLSRLLSENEDVPQPSEFTGVEA